MKKINLNYVAALCAVFILFITASCKKNAHEDVTPAPGMLMFHLHTNADTGEVGAYGDTITMTGGRKISVTTAQLYISHIRLVKTDGTEIDGPGTVFMHQGTEEYELGNVPSANYKTVKFDVGLSDSQNASTPSTSDAILYQPSMWFGATAQPNGYVFVNFQGSIDTATAANGSNLIPFAYKIGTTSHRVTVTMPDKSFTVSPNEESIVHLTVNYAKLFNGVTLNNSANLSVTTTADNSTSLGNQIAGNISSMFAYEQ